MEGGAIGVLGILRKPGLPALPPPGLTEEGPVDPIASLLVDSNKASPSRTKSSEAPEDREDRTNPFNA